MDAPGPATIVRCGEVAHDGGPVIEQVALTQAEADALVVEWARNALASAKSAVIAAIDAKTLQLLATGFTYTPQTSGATQHFFGLDPTSVANWTGLKNLAELDAASLSPQMQYPFLVSDVTGTPVGLASLADIHAFYVAGGLRSAVIQQGGIALKAQVAAATTVDQVNAIEDTRT